MAHGKTVHELKEILGIRCFAPHKFLEGDVQRRSGPLRPRRQYLVRGTFIETELEIPDDFEIVPQAETYWVDEDDLLETIDHNEIQQCVYSLFDEIENGLDAARVSAPPVQVPSASGRASSSRNRKRLGSGAA